MQRFVYSPKVHAYVKTDGGIIDVTPYIVRGNVHRMVDQVSTATVEIRNTAKRFTRPGNPIFHPQDPITIYLTRIINRPVQVFTGYLDTTPYLELYPGTVTLAASCTLKKLLHTYWDPALPFVNEFMKEYGWTANRSTGQLYNLAAESRAAKRKDGQVDLTDSSIGKLLFGVLEHIGHWHPDRVYIQQLPFELVKKLTSLYDEIAVASEESQKGFQQFLGDIIGTGSYGGGDPGAGGGVADGGSAYANESICIKIGRELGVHDDVILAMLMAGIHESGFDPKATGDSGLAHGIFQIHPEWIGKGGLKDRRNVSQSARWWYWAAAQTTNLKHPVGNLAGLSQAVEGSAAGESNYVDNESKARAILAKYDRENSKDGSSNSNNTDPSGGSWAKKQSDYTTETEGNTGTQVKNKTGRDIATLAVPVQGWKPNVVGPCQAFGATSPPCSRGHTHAGLDMTGADGSTVRSSIAGTVAYVGDWSDGGLVTVRSNQGLKAGGVTYPKGTLFGFGHVVNYRVKVGDSVKPGTALAEIKSGLGHTHLWVNTSSGASPGADGNTDPLPLMKVAYSGKDVETSGDTTTLDSGGTTDDILPTAKAAAFATFFEFPGELEVFEAMALQGRRSLMNDQPLFPFVQQLCQGSMRSMMSMPNGNFLAFFPDYFGGLGTRSPYWQIDDIEIMNGSISLSDEFLATHVYAVGDTVPGPQGFGGDMAGLLEKLTSTGVITIFDAFQTGFVNTGFFKTKEQGKDKDKFPTLADRGDAIKFLQRYGARPQLIEAPMIRSHYYEAFLAYQQFLLLWSKQFLTTFELTFMPELYPGGIVAFPDHGIQCYIDEVQHNFDLEAGFNTTANLSAPAALTSHDTNVSQGMVRAFAL